MAPTGLLSLPPEIIADICRHLLIPKPDLPPSIRAGRLSRFSQTCKYINQTATPALYSCFFSSPTVMVSVRFLAALCRRPELGRLVQTLNFRYISLVSETLEHHKVYRAAAARLGVELGDMPRRNPYETLIQLIIAHTPNVKQVEVSTDRFIMSASSVPTVLNQIAAQDPIRISFPRLEKLTVKHFYVTTLPIKYYGGLVALAPNLRDLWIEPSCPLNHPWTHPRDRLSLRSVTKLTLQFGCLTKNQFEMVVDSCGPLVFFQHNYSVLSFEHSPSVTPAEAVRILERHADTLRFLALDLAWRNRDSPVSFYAAPLCLDGEQILSLKVFKRLSDLSLDGSCFLFPTRGDAYYHEQVFTQLLPRSIRSFKIVVALPGTIENLRTVVQSKSHFPNLQAVFMENKVFCPQILHNVFFVWHDLTALEDMMARAGIYFKQDCVLLGSAPSSSPESANSVPPPPPPPPPPQVSPPGFNTDTPWVGPPYPPIPGPPLGFQHHPHAGNANPALHFHHVHATDAGNAEQPLHFQHLQDASAEADDDATDDDESDDDESDDDAQEGPAMPDVFRID